MFVSHSLYIISASLSINEASVSADDVDLSPITSVGQCVCLSVCLSWKCTVAKRLIGYGCHLGWWVGRLMDGCII